MSVVGVVVARKLTQNSDKVLLFVEDETRLIAWRKVFQNSSAMRQKRYLGKHVNAGVSAYCTLYIVHISRRSQVLGSGVHGLCRTHEHT